MNNLSKSMKKFLGNKNTVTILGVVLCIAILYIGYSYRINQKVQTVELPVAAETIQPKTKITTDMIRKANIPASFLSGEYARSAEEVVGKYSNYNALISEGSLFYRDLIVSGDELPDAALTDIPEGYSVVNYAVDMNTTYANSMMPGNKINIYMKWTTDDGKVVFGRLYENVDILAVKDSAGQNVFEASDESRTPAYMLFALPEVQFLIFEASTYITTNDIEIVLVPNTIDYKDKEATVELKSADIVEFILGKVQAVDNQEEDFIELLNELETKLQ